MRLYEASEVGYEYELTPTPRGVTLTFGGLSDSNIVETILEYMMTSEWELAYFRTCLSLVFQCLLIQPRLVSEGWPHFSGSEFTVPH